MRSLRSALNAQGISGCPNGLLGINSFYHHSVETRNSFGFTRLSEIIAALHWPSGFQAMTDHPADDGQSWQNNPDGLAHDDVTWFFTRRDAFLTIPISTDLQGLSDSHFDNRHSPIALGNGATYSLVSDEPDLSDYDIIQIDPIEGYNHLGGLTIHSSGGQSILYIPVQDESGRNKPIIYALQSIQGQSLIDQNWWAIIPKTGDQGAWCAFDAIARRLYTSDFYPIDKPPGSSVDVYSIGTPFQSDVGGPVVGQPLALELVGSMQLFESDGVTPVRLHRLQGGFITERRHLYLVQDDGTGIVGFDLITGRKRITIPVDYRYGTSGKYQEIEGACLFSNPTAPGMSGDIHVQLYENGWGPIGRDFWIKHYSVTDPNDRPFI